MASRLRGSRFPLAQAGFSPLFPVIQHLAFAASAALHVAFSGGDYTLTYFWLGLLGLPGMVILKRPLFTSGMRILALKCSRWVMPI